MAIASDHAQGFPAPEDLYRPEVNTGHYKATSEGVAVTVPCVAVKAASILPSVAEARLGPLYSAAEELSSLPVGVGKQTFPGISRTLTIPGKIYER